MKFAFFKKISSTQASEEVPVQIFLRPVSGRATKVLVRTSLTPTQITFLAFLLEMIGAVLFAYDNRLAIVCASILLYSYLVFDCVDGEIARAKKQTSELGALIDYFLDRLGEVFVYSAVTFMLYTSTGLNTMLVLGGFVLSGNFFMNDIRQKSNVEKSNARTKPRKGLLTYLGYGGSTNLLILVASGLVGRLFDGMLLIGAFSYVYGIGRFVEGCVRIRRKTARTRRHA